jgi:hypothetical protein
LTLLLAIVSATGVANFGLDTDRLDVRSVIVSSWSPGGNVQLVSMVVTSASRSIRPCSAIAAATKPATGLLSEAAWKSVSGVTGRPGSASP